jgi:mRNA-decapping enzyme subunit 2
MIGLIQVLEETGVDVTPYIKENDYIERVIRDQRIRLFIAGGLDEDTEFATQTRKEIGVLYRIYKGYQVA